MSNVLVIGTQWGDEGKGKIVDLLSDQVDIIARYQGGHNAGHTVILNGKQVVLHLIPTGILHAQKKCVIGNGTVIEPCALIKEITGLQKIGINFEERLLISERAHIIMPYHCRADLADNKATGLRHIGTTGRGIGPAYKDKISRIGIQMGDLLDKELFREKLKLNLASYQVEDENKSFERIFSDYNEYADILAPYVCDVSYYLNQAIKEGKRILFESAQGTMLDIDHGTYPYVTSSNATAGGACTGLGIGPQHIHGSLGITKAYTTRVGNGPFPTQADELTAQALRKHGDEYGATTGRPRRCGWFDSLVVNFAVRVSGIQSLAITKLDVLDKSETIKIAVAYEWQGQRIKRFPANLRAVEQCKPIYEELPGWMSSTRGITAMEKLPPAAINYLKRLRELIGVEISVVSTGPTRAETIINKGTKLANWLGL